MSDPEFVLSIACPDRRGIVAEVTKFLFERNCNILDSQQFGDRGNGRFFMRVHGRRIGLHDFVDHACGMRLTKRDLDQRHDLLGWIVATTAAVLVTLGCVVRISETSQLAK